jgi:hypothetical protein
VIRLSRRKTTGFYHVLAIIKNIYLIEASHERRYKNP